MQQFRRAPSLPVAAGKAERLLATMALLYGLAILNPWTDVLSLYASSAMTRLCSQEYVWGTVIASIGLGQLLAWRSRSRVARLVASASASMMGMSLAALFALGGLTSWHLSSVLVSFTSPGSLLLAVSAIFEMEIFAELLKK